MTISWRSEIHNIDLEDDMDNKKSMSLLLMLSIFLFCIILGCISNQSSTTELTQQSEQTPQPTPTSTSILQPTTAPSSVNIASMSEAATPTSQASYDDESWLSYEKEYNSNIFYYLKLSSTAASQADFSSEIVHSQNLENQCEAAINDNNKFKNLSPKYQDINNEWLLYLQDMKTGSHGVAVVLIDSQNGVYDLDGMQKASDIQKRGMNHFGNVERLLNNVS
jgi:hypothetical protein